MRTEQVKNNDHNGLTEEEFLAAYEPGDYELSLIHI